MYRAHTHTLYTRTHIHTYNADGRAGTSTTAVCPQRARMHIFLATTRSINSAILRAPLDLTSRFSIVRCAAMHVFASGYKKKGKEERERGGGSSLENASRVLSRPILLRALLTLPYYSSSRVVESHIGINTGPGLIGGKVRLGKRLRLIDRSLISFKTYTSRARKGSGS